MIADLYDGDIDAVAVFAFPRQLATTVRAVSALLSKNALHHRTTLGAFQVQLAGETLQIPYRVYCNRAQVLACIGRDDVDGVVALCLGTRHHDGFLREHCVRRLLVRDEAWIVPFVVQLLGEYVVEISSAIEQALPHARRAHYAQFLNDNARHIETIGRRVVSYWHYYYRKQFPMLAEYPAARALAALKAMQQSGD